MAFNYTILSPKYSFVKFDSPETADDCCRDAQDFCIPIFAASDLRFQLRVVGATEADTDGIFALGNDKVLLSMHTVAGTFLKSFTITDSLYFLKIRLSATEILYTWINDLVDFADHAACNDCFKLGLKILEEDISDEETFFSNCIKRICSDCFTSVLEFYCNDDFAGFKYCNTYGFVNRVRLPLYFTQPGYPEDETVYTRSSGFRKVLKLNVIKEYLAMTEFFPEHIHDKVKVLLSHDITNITGEKYTGGFRKSSAYSPEWDEDDRICFAPATFKALVNPDVAKNTNCQSCEDLNPGCAQIAGVDTDEQYITADEWEIAINNVGYAAGPVPPVNQYIDVFWRQGGSTGAYTFAGNITCDASGNIVTPTPPFRINPIDDDWSSVELKLVNQCGGIPFIVQIWNPCYKIAGMNWIASDDGADWSVSADYVTCSVWPKPSEYKTIGIYYREYGSGSGWTHAGDLDWFVNADFTEQLDTNPFVISGLSADWDKVEIRLDYDCERSLTQIVSNPLSGCAAITVINTETITETQGDFYFSRVLPTPAGGYDWELWDDTMTTMLQSGNITGPGGTLFLTITGLTTGTDYILRIRTVCETGVTYSSWTDLPFSTP